jgi:hypothetical protein
MLKIGDHGLPILQSEADADLLTLENLIKVLE